MSWLVATTYIYTYCVVVGAELCGTPISDWSRADIHPSYGYRGFYKYYQIRRVGKSTDGASEPKKKGELKSRWEGSHSPFGFVWQVASATGWTIEYILHEVNYQTLIMMLSDAPRYVDKTEDEAEQSAEDEAEGILSIFQSRLSKSE